MLTDWSARDCLLCLRRFDREELLNMHELILFHFVKCPHLSLHSACEHRTSSTRSLSEYRKYLSP